MIHRDVSNEYDRLATSYDRRWAHYVNASTQHTLRHLELREGARLLDLGCGTGVLLRAIGRSAPEVVAVGLDLSAAMLAVAAGRATGATTLVRGDVTHLPFPDHRFDVVVSASSLHYWRRPDLALAEAARVLKPEGRLVVTDWCGDFVLCRLLDRTMRLFNRAHYRTYGTSECTALLDAAGFRMETIERYKINWLWGLMTASAVKRLRPAPRSSPNNLEFD
jgi:ubiquinone/menaquinone biosynthesis C-methylase UbiE